MEESAKETVIVVHGTFAAPQPGASQWYQPVEGVPAFEGFIAKLNDALQKRGSAARCWAHCRRGDQGFHWSGENSWIDRTEAASKLGNYVRKLRNEGWSCHIVAHSHGGNVVLEALPQITTAPNAPLGKIVTLGTPFMDTMSPILHTITRTHRAVIQTYWTVLGLFMVLIAGSLIVISVAESTPNGAASGTMITLLTAAIVVAAAAIVAVFFGRKSHTAKSISQMQPKFLAIGSPMDEPWQLLHHLRNTSNPMAVQTNLIRYLISSIQTHISRSHQIARIYGAKSYRDLKPVAKLFLALAYLMAPFILIAYWQQMHEPSFFTSFSVWWSIISGYGLLLWLLSVIFGPEFQLAFGSPLRWCFHRLGAITGIFGEIATYIVRSRGWSVVLAIAMGLDGYRHQLPLIEQYPSSVPDVKYEDMPTGAQERALAMRGAWIDRHLNDIAQTFSKLVVTAADIDLLQRAIEADQTLVHAAYYTDDECIARIADWIARRG